MVEIIVLTGKIRHSKRKFQICVYKLVQWQAQPLPPPGGKKFTGIQLKYFLIGFNKLFGQQRKQRT